VGGMQGEADELIRGEGDAAGDDCRDIVRRVVEGGGAEAADGDGVGGVGVALEMRGDGEGDAAVLVDARADGDGVARVEQRGVGDRLTVSAMVWTAESAVVAPSLACAWTVRVREAV